MSGKGRTFYEEVDAILGNRAASCPAILLDSSGTHSSIG